MKKLLIPLVFFATSQKIHAQANPYYNAQGAAKTPVTRTIESFGAIANDGLDDSKAFQDAATFFSNSGAANVDYNTQYGVLQLGAGTYIVGEQVVYNSTTATLYAEPQYGAIWANLDGLIIQGAGDNLTKIKVKPGGYFGYFEASDSTAPHDGKYFTDGGISAHTGMVFGLGYNALNVIIRDMEIDGSSDTYIVGKQASPYSDFNCFSYGIAAYGGRWFSLENLYIHNFGEDGIYLEASPQMTPAGKWNVTMDNVRSLWNGRQALSWVHGRDVKIENSTFAYTRLNEGNYDSDPNPVLSTVAGSPGANIDIEPGYDWSEIRNGLFNNCKIIGNSGTSASLVIQLNTDSITFNNCDIKTFVNTNPDLGGSWEAIGLQHIYHRNLTFKDCDIVGTVDFLKYQEAPLPDVGLTRFLNCSISNNNYKDPYNRYEYYPILYLYERVLFDKCVINRNNKRPIFASWNADLTGSGIPNPDNFVTLNDCTITSSYEREWSEYEFDFAGRMYGLRFTGNTRFTHSPTTNPSRTNYNFLQQATLNGSSMYVPKNSFTFSNFDQFTGWVYGFYFDASFDTNAMVRPIIIGETPCEYLDVYLGEGTTTGEFSAIRNDGRPLYIGAGVKVTVRKGAALVLSGDVYLAGKIVVEDGGYLYYSADTRIHYLNTPSAPPLASLLPPTTARPPLTTIWTNDQAVYSYTTVPHLLRSELMAPNQYLRSAVAAYRSNYDNPNMQCKMCYEDPTSYAKYMCYPRMDNLHPFNGNANADFYFPSNDDSDIGIYPNPATDKVNISLNGANKASDVQLLDLNGRQLYRTSSRDGGELEISLHKYPQGTYLIRISNENNTVVKKVVKVN